MYNAEGRLNDAQAVQIGSISASMFALVADGKNGFRVIQMISPENVPENAGFSPKPNPILIATYPDQGRRGDRRSAAAWTATASWTRPASRRWSSAAAGRVRSTSRRCRRSCAIAARRRRGRQKGARTGAYYRVDDVW